MNFLLLRNEARLLNLRRNSEAQQGRRCRPHSSATLSASPQMQRRNPLGRQSASLLNFSGSISHAQILVLAICRKTTLRVVLCFRYLNFNFCAMTFKRGKGSCPESMPTILDRKKHQLAGRPRSDQKRPRYEALEILALLVPRALTRQ